MDLTRELELVLEALDGAGVPTALCGGLAMAVHGHARFTQDIDLLLQLQWVKAAKRALLGAGFDIDAGWPPTTSTDDPGIEIYRVTKLVDDDALPVDLVVVEPALQQAWASRVRMAWRGREIVVVSREGLALMKRLSGRPVDLADLAAIQATDSGKGA